MNTLLNTIQNSLASSDEETRRTALQSLRSVPFTDSRSLLLSAMGDESWRVRKEAVDTFIQADPDEDAISLLLELLRNEDNAGLRNSAAEAVIRMGERSIRPLTALVRDTDPDVRKFVVDVMGSIGRAEFVPALIETLCDADVNVAAAAAEHLGRIGDTQAVPELIQAIIHNHGVLFRFSALAALGRLASPSSVPEEIRNLADQEILSKAVYECLGSIGDQSVVSLLMRGCTARQKSSRKAAILAWYRIFLRSNTDVRIELEDSLSAQADSSMVQALIDVFDLRDAHLAESVTAMLGIIGDMQGAATMLAAYSNERLSAFALKALKSLGSRGIDTIVSMFPDSDEASRSAICTLLGDLSCHGEGELIRNGLHDSSPMVRRASVASVAKLGMIDYSSEIMTLLDDLDAEVRAAVISCLKVLALIDRRPIQEITLRLMNSSDPRKRHDAALLYSALGDAERLSILVKDEDAGVRQAAVASLGGLTGLVDYSILKYALVDEDPDVRIAAAETMGTLGGDDILDALNRSLDDEDLWVQCAILKSIAQISPRTACEAVRTLFPRATGLLMITCLDVIEKNCVADASDLLETSLNDTDLDVTNRAVQLLARQGAEWVLENADRLMIHKNRNVRIAWARTVSLLSSDSARGIFEKALIHEQDEQVLTVIRNLQGGLA